MLIILTLLCSTVLCTALALQQSATKGRRPEIQTRVEVLAGIVGADGTVQFLPRVSVRLVLGVCSDTSTPVAAGSTSLRGQLVLQAPQGSFTLCAEDTTTAKKLNWSLPLVAHGKLVTVELSDANGTPQALAETNQTSGKGFRPKGQEACVLKGTAIWKYNDYVGLKADVGASAYAFRRFEPKRTLSESIVAKGKTSEEEGFFVAKADGLGKFEFSPLPPGTYDVVIRSYSTKRNILVAKDPSADRQLKVGRMPGMTLEDSIDNSIENLNLTVFRLGILDNHFEATDYKAVFLLLSLANKYDVEKVDCGSGQTRELTVDFGNTYF